jgi:hypothetical protein
VLWTPQAPPPPGEAAQWALGSWIDGQIRYFETAISKLEVGVRRTKWIFRSLLGVSLVAGAVLLGYALGGRHPMDHPAGEALFLAMALLVAAAALVRAWSAVMGHEAFCARYEAARGVYERARERLVVHLQQGGPPDDRFALEIMRSLGRAAIEENTAWLLAYRDRPLEIHTAA